MLLIAVIVVPVVGLWFYALVEIGRRQDLSRSATEWWLIAVVLFPVLGALVYLTVRPRSAPDVVTPGLADDPLVDDLEGLIARRRSGELSEEAFAERRDRLFHRKPPPTT